MENIRDLGNGVFYVGGNDRRTALFESAFPVPSGISYNSYLALDEKTVLLDTVDKAISELFFENIEAALNGRTLDYVVVNHVEPDHSATLGELVRRYPKVQIVGGTLTIKLLQQFFDFDVKVRAVEVAQGETLKTGKHSFTFYTAPMVHWPEVTVCYDATDKTLYSADAFGAFGTLDGNLYADETDFAADYLVEARRYYTNIVGKYGAQTAALLEKAASLDIAQIRPLHGRIWRKNLGYIVDKYKKWASYTPEDNAVIILFASVYGHTENAVEIVASELAKRNVKGIKIYNLAFCDPSLIVAEAFRVSHIVLAATTYNMSIFPAMEDALKHLKATNLQNRTAAVIENGSWAPASGKLMREMLSEMKNMTVLDPGITLKSSIKDKSPLITLAETLAKSLKAQK